MKICVVPTNRPAALTKWLAAWQPVADWDKLVVVFDGPPEAMHFVGGSSDVEVWNWETIREALGDQAWIISRRDSAIRCFGFYRAWQLGATYIGTLDDDCFPVGAKWFDNHIDNMRISRWHSTVDDLNVRGIN